MQKGAQHFFLNRITAVETNPDCECIFSIGIREFTFEVDSPRVHKYFSQHIAQTYNVKLCDALRKTSAFIAVLNFTAENTVRFYAKDTEFNSEKFLCTL